MIVTCDAIDKNSTTDPVYKLIQSFKESKTNKKSKHPWVITCISCNAIQDWISAHSSSQLIGQNTFCIVVADVFESYFSKPPPASRTRSQTEEIRRNSKSLKYAMCSCSLPDKAITQEFNEGLDSLINLATKCHGHITSQKGNPKRRVLIINIATNLYDSFNALPDITTLTSLLLIVESADFNNLKRSVRNTYTDELKAEIIAGSTKRRNKTNKNVINSELITQNTINTLKKSTIHKEEPINIFENKLRSLDTFMNAEQVKNDADLIRQLSLVKNMLYERIERK